MPALVLKVSSLKFDRDDMFPREMSAQKGPTCWYYAARLIREFHDQTYKWSSTYDNTNERRVEQRISAIRKSQTQLDDLLTRLRQSTTMQDVSERAGQLFDVLEDKAHNDPNFRQRIAQNFPQVTGLVRNPVQTPKGEFVTEVRRYFSGRRLEELSNQLWLDAIFGTLAVNDWRDIYAQYGFRSVALNSLGDIQGVRAALETHGPLLCVGHYAMQNYSTIGNMIEVGWSTNKLDFDYVDSDHLALQNGLHAIVLCGVVTATTGPQNPVLEIVVYKDPNRPHVYFGFDFGVLRARQGTLQGGHNVFHLPCGNAAPCSHTINAKVFQ